MKPIKIIISGGGTGGHIFPALAIAIGMQKINLNNSILFVGAKGKMEMEKIPKAGFLIKGLWISGFQRSLSFENLLFPLKLVLSIIQAFRVLKKFKPNIVVGTGGFASGPLLWVAQLLDLPTILQEQNSYPGFTNRILSKNANRICVAYDGMEKFFPKSKILLTGNPVRSNLVNLISSVKSKKHFDLNPKIKTLVVLGGSLGSERINEIIKSNLDLFFGGYPITPASEILHYLAQYKNFGVKTFQAEDEIAGICSAIGASFTGSLAITTTSGPGLALKGEGLGLAIMTELPLVVVDVQRGMCGCKWPNTSVLTPVSYTHLRAHETREDLVCRLLL